MYHLRNYEPGQNYIAVELSEKPGMEIDLHWLNPLFIKCSNE